MRTRLGMLIRAGASNREMAGALGVNIKLLYTLVFGLGAALAGLAGLMQAPILTVQIGMGENILILAFVVIIIGGIGSIRGAFVAAILVGLIDTIGRAFLPDLLRLVMSSRGASTVAPAHVVDDDLSGDGDRAGGAAAGSVPGVGQMTAWLTPRNVVVAALLVFLALVPVYAALTGNAFLMTLFTRIVILAMAATSLNLILGYGGMVSFGHAVYLGIGGYAIGILAHEGIGSGFIQWPVAIAASALFALAVGALSLRTRGLYFIMITLAFAQLVYYFGVGLDRYGGDDGLQIYRRSQFVDPINLSNRTQFYYLCLALLVGEHLSHLADREFALRPGDPGLALERPPHAGDRLPDLSLSADLLRHRRHDVRARRRAARQSHRIRQPRDDALDTLRRSHRDGGARRHGLDLRPADRRGDAAGAGGDAAGADQARRDAVRRRRRRRAPRNTGRSCSARCSCWWCCSRAAASTGCWRACAVADALLAIDGLTKRFGGVIASDGIALAVPAGELHAIIGPNGAGKTTLIGQLTGEIAPDAGRIRFAGHDITALPVHARSQLGLARSFQITSLFNDFTALDNVALAVQAHSGHSFHFWRDARKDAALREPARETLARVGLAGREDVIVVEHEPRRAPAARDRHGAGDPSAHAAARRADGRAWARRNPCA